MLIWCRVRSNTFEYYFELWLWCWTMIINWYWILQPFVWYIKHEISSWEMIRIWHFEWQLLCYNFEISLSSKCSFLFEDILELIITILNDSFANVIHEYFYWSRFEQVFVFLNLHFQTKKSVKSSAPNGKKGENGEFESNNLIVTKSFYYCFTIFSWELWEKM